MKVKAFFAGLITGLAAAGAAIVAVLAALNRDAKDRYEITEQVRDEIEKKAEAARTATKDEVLAATPHDVVATLSPGAQSAIDDIEHAAVDAALARARDLSHAHADGGGARGADRAGGT